MGLSVAYRHEEFSQPVPEKADKTKKVSKRDARVELWMARQYQRDYDQAIKENMAEILEIQKSIPGWMPDKNL